MCSLHLWGKESLVCKNVDYVYNAEASNVNDIRIYEKSLREKWLNNDTIM